MNEDEDLDLTPEEAEALQQLSYGYPRPEERENIYNYFKKVITMMDNTKTANLTIDELGLVKIPVRTNQEIALYCDAMGMGNIKDAKGFAGYFMKEAQILLGTSLSREGFLNKLAVTQKREVESKTRRPVVNKGWFKKKTRPEDEIKM
jgi:hypothetical protein